MDHVHVLSRPPALQNGHSYVVVAHISKSSPPVSPANSPRLRSGRAAARGSMPSKLPKLGSPGSVKATPRHPPTVPVLQPLTQLLLAFFFRRHRLLLLISFVSFTGTLLYTGGDQSMPDSFPLPGRYRPGSVYRSDLVFESLWPEMERADAASQPVSLTLPFE